MLGVVRGNRVFLVVFVLVSVVFNAFPMIVCVFGVNSKFFFEPSEPALGGETLPQNPPKKQTFH